MIVEIRTVIDGKPCSELFRKNEIIVYTPDTQHDDENTLYFTENGKVLFVQTIKADYGQNVGYISDIQFEGVNA